jgi:hypothetical protein
MAGPALDYDVIVRQQPPQEGVDRTVRMLADARGRDRDKG